MLLCASAAAADMCRGDCDRNGMPTSAEVAMGVEIALGREPLTTCPGLEGEDLAVEVDELILAVISVMVGCAPTATATAAAATPTLPPNTATPTRRPGKTGTPTATATPSSTASPTTLPGNFFCDLPGSVQNTGPGVVVIPGAPMGSPDLTWMQLPIGFCAHFFANVGNVRQVRFAPNGDLFVTSPGTFTTGGGPGGIEAIAILPDDDGDGRADTRITFLPNMRSTQGLLFTDGWFYYQMGSRIMRRPYTVGDREPRGPAEMVADIAVYTSALHWPKVLDQADDGTIYVTNGGDQTERCNAGRPFHGGILALDGTPGGRQVAKGFRNPISLRCARGQGKCFALELSRDYTAATGGREKLVPIRDGADDDWGFPCCAARDLPHHDIRPIPDCSGVSAESASFYIGGTPFDLDFETGRWPEPWKNRVFIPLHGAYGLWEGARVVAIARDAMTGDALPGDDLTGISSGSMSDFALGWGDGLRKHGRPATVTFAPDGRLFLGNDNDGNIVWIAPLDLPLEP